jgi:hypothetical protein
MRYLAVLTLLVAALPGCRQSREGQTTTAATQTIAPASAPSAPNGSDAMTQTVDVEDSRSEAEGGTLTSTAVNHPPATTATAAAPAKKTASKKKK